MANLKRDFLQDFPERLVISLAEVAASSGVEMFVTGGAVRDAILDRRFPDLDITVSDRALECAREFSRRTQGAYVLLDEEESVARVVLHDYSIDFAGFRKQASDIVSDLKERDFTINALAVAFDHEHVCLREPRRIIDPAGGVADIDLQIVRVTNEKVFEDDPLRLLRAYRFAAALNFEIASETEELISRNRQRIMRSSVERINYELQRIMMSPQPHRVFIKMATGGLLWEIFPELQAGVGLKQPASHHLDVFSHSLETLRTMELLQSNIKIYYPEQWEEIESYLAEPSRITLMRWAALFHDLGKPETHHVKDEKITFYSHDKGGSRVFLNIAERLRWGRDSAKLVAKLISHHMWPFHLNNARNTQGITAKACLRLVKAVGFDLPGLFLLAMADSLAGQGPGKPTDTEKSLAELYSEVAAVYKDSIKPLFDEPPLLNGHDLQQIFHLEPGPVFKKILTGLLEAQVEKEVCNREDALEWVTVFLEKYQGKKFG